MGGKMSPLGGNPSGAERRQGRIGKTFLVLNAPEADLIYRLAMDKGDPREISAGWLSTTTPLHK